MEDLQTILDRVLAGVGEMVAERKARPFAGESCAPGHGFAGEDGTNSAVQKIAGGHDGQCFKPSVMPFTADHSLPAQRVTGPKSTAGGKRLRVLKPCSCSDGVHDRIAQAPKPQAHPKRIS